MVSILEAAKRLTWTSKLSSEAWDWHPRGDSWDQGEAFLGNESEAPAIGWKITILHLLHTPSNHMKYSIV